MLNLIEFKHYHYLTLASYNWQNLLVTVVISANKFICRMLEMRNLLLFTSVRNWRPTFQKLLKILRGVSATVTKRSEA